jgi:hypothetical protein
MGRFDALTELDENQPPEKSLAPEPVALGKQRSPAPLSGKPGMHQDAVDKQHGTTYPISPPPKGKQPAIQQTGKSGDTLRLKEGKYEKYSTYLRPGYKKELKLIAADRECNAYDLLDEALTLYLSTLKK